MLRVGPAGSSGKHTDLEIQVTFARHLAGLSFTGEERWLVTLELGYAFGYAIIAMREW